MPPEEYGFDFQEDNYDQFMEDEEALEALREAENDQHKVQKSPEKKKPRLDQNSPIKLDSPVKFTSQPLGDITNHSLIDEEPMEVAYRIPRIGERKVYRRMPLEGDYQTFTVSDGERFFVKLKEDEPDFDFKSFKNSSANFSGLCGESYASLLEQAIQEQLRLQEQTQNRPNAEHLSEDSGVESASSDEDSVSAENLWVEKFKPRSYMQLLSDDGTNR